MISVQVQNYPRVLHLMFLLLLGGNKMLSKFKNVRGFTLIELLVVIAILSVLLVIVLVAANPAKNTQDARNVKRRADVLTILNAVNQYFVDNGAFPTDTPAVGDTEPLQADDGNAGTDESDI